MARTATRPISAPMEDHAMTKNDAGLSHFMPQLAGLSAALLYLSEEGNDRLTINQAAFFLLAGGADARGGPLTLSQIMERGEGILNPSLANTYKVLLEPNRKDYNKIGLGWLTREADPDDERRKFLKLTPKGTRVLRATLLAMGHNSYKDRADGGTA